jgi:hypothetical protein
VAPARRAETHAKVRCAIVRPDFGRIRIPDGRMVEDMTISVVSRVHLRARCDDLDDGAPISSLT